MLKKITNLSQNKVFFPNQSGTGTIPKVEKKTLVRLTPNLACMLLLMTQNAVRFISYFIFDQAISRKL
jgi:hypothetical protein